MADRDMRRWQKDEKEIKLIWAKRADGILLHHLARMMLMIEIIDDDVSMTVDIAMVIEEIKEDVEVVEVVDMYIGIKTKVRPVLPVVSLT